MRFLKRELKAVVIAATIGGLACGSAFSGRIPNTVAGERMPSYLFREISFLKANTAYDYDIPVIVQFQKEAFDRFRRNRVLLRRDALEMIQGWPTRLRAGQILTLLQSEDVAFISLDAPVHASNQNLQAIGADRVHAIANGGLLEGDLSHFSSGFRGRGVAIAVVDSGIDGSHPDLLGRVVHTVDFSSDKGPRGVDLNGHGTHVAGIIAGSGGVSHGASRGAAPAADLINVKVIGVDGTGQTSELIRAIEWMVENRERLNIRIANLSLGAPPLQSAHHDPLAQAVLKMIFTGIVAVTSAGNLGKTEEYPKIWGGIVTPGMLPQAITVGAVNTQGTATHQDDVATTYSSRGPTYLDHVFKPDLAAPGNRIVSLAASDAYLTYLYPELLVDRYHLELSGSSMATAFTSATVALMLEANPRLTPALAKLILNMSAARMTEAHPLEQGNGLVNALTAVRLAQALDVQSHQLTRPVSPYWRLGDELVWAGGALASGEFVVHSRLVSDGAPAIWGSGLRWQDYLVPGAVDWALDLLGSQSPIWGADLIADGMIWSDGSIWTDATLRLDGSVWIDGMVGVDGAFWVDALATSKSVFGAGHQTGDR